jgi:hypothetical protein
LEKFHLTWKSLILNKKEIPFEINIPIFPGPDRFFLDLVLNILCLGYDKPIAITKQVAPGRAIIPCARQ